MAAADESLYMVSQTSLLEKDDELDSLPSLSTDEIYSEDEDDAQAEWERSLDQVQMLLTMVLVPWMGKYFGRKFAYWSWARYMNWAHDVEVKFTNKKAFNVVGAVEAARSL
ncbi:hypothetical protein V2A60_001733 [Cordyceps javanica]|uniref:Uncharacterized protein n=1 Tax=Cordyceps javanica TaxID=43265 RepID=A0A545VG26_9HYPO|nr:hypothetical protein IF1G_00608 [Cordyceps javanica]TQW11857.1 hypothetical protein IF2G_00588 [Cordyceps javanica]